MLSLIEESGLFVEEDGVLDDQDTVALSKAMRTSLLRSTGGAGLISSCAK